MLRSTEMTLMSHLARPVHCIGTDLNLNLLRVTVSEATSEYTLREVTTG